MMKISTSRSERLTPSGILCIPRRSGVSAHLLTIRITHVHQRLDGNLKSFSLSLYPMISPLYPAEKFPVSAHDCAPDR